MTKAISRTAYSIVLLCALLQLFGCAATPAAHEFLDPKTSQTITYVTTPVVFYKDRSGRAAFARDFVSVGPIRAIQTGRQRFFLWFGVWNTMQVDSDPSRGGAFEVVTLFADGEPMPLELAGWSATAIGSSRPVYAKPVSSATDIYYEVTIDQIRAMAVADEIRIQTSGEQGTQYELWDRSASARLGLTDFLSATDY